MEKIKCILCGAPIRDNFKFIEDDLKRCPACNSEIIESIEQEEEPYNEMEFDYVLDRDFYEMC